MMMNFRVGFVPQANQYMLNACWFGFSVGSGGSTPPVTTVFEWIIRARRRGRR